MGKSVTMGVFNREQCRITTKTIIQTSWVLCENGQVERLAEGDNQSMSSKYLRLSVELMIESSMSPDCVISCKIFASTFPVPVGECRNRKK